MYFPKGNCETSKIMLPWNPSFVYMFLSRYEAQPTEYSSLKINMEENLHRVLKVMRSYKFFVHLRCHVMCEAVTGKEVYGDFAHDEFIYP